MNIKKLLICIMAISFLSVSILPNNMYSITGDTNIEQVWHMDGWQLYTCNDDEVCLTKNNQISVRSIDNSDLIWSKETNDQIYRHDYHSCYSQDSRKLIYLVNTDEKSTSWLEMNGRSSSAELSFVFGSIFNDNSVVVGSNYSKNQYFICDISTDEILEHVTMDATKGHSIIIAIDGDSRYFQGSGSIYCVRNNEQIWTNWRRIWEEDDEAFQEDYQGHLTVMSKDYLFIQTRITIPCCILVDHTIKVIDKNTGNTVEQISGNVGDKAIVCNEQLIYTTGSNPPNWGWDNTVEPNTLHIMDTKTLEDKWTFQHEDYSYLITKRNQVKDGKLYVQLIDISKEVSSRPYDKIEVICLSTGTILDRYIFDNNISNFDVTSSHLIIETNEGVTCYTINEHNDCPYSKSDHSDKKKLQFQIDRESYYLNDNIGYMDISPTVINDRTLLPARYVVEPLGGDVAWDEQEKKVTCILGDVTIEMWIDNPIAKVNGEEVQIDPHNPEVTPTIIDDRTFVPVRFLAENLGCQTEWDAESKEIILTYSP